MALADTFEGWWPSALQDLTRTQLLVRAVSLFVLYQVAATLYNGLWIRWTFARLRSQGIALPQPYSLLLGHLPLLLAIRRTHYPNTNAPSHFPLRFLALHWQTYFPDGPESGPPDVVYLDLWPLVSQPLAIVTHPALCQALVAERTLPRHDQVKRLSRGIAGPRTLFEWDGAAHRVWRTRLNPGFSMKNLLGHVAMGRVVDEVVIFAENIKRLAPVAKDGEGDEEDEEEAKWGEVFQMFPMAVALTFDIICSVALNFSPGEQVDGPTQMQLAFDVLRERHLVFKHLFTLPRLLNPFWHLEHYQKHRIIDKILLPHIHQQLPQNQQEQANDNGKSSSSSSSSSSAGAARPKTVVDLALKEIKQEQEEKGATTTISLSQDFIDDVIGLTKQFIFAGHDTTAITLSFAFHYLTRHPDAMRRLRAEHDEVFGREDIGQTPAKLRQAPHLINALPFTAAVVKETLRLCPVASTVRNAGPEYQLVHPETGQVFPTHNFILVSGTMCLHFDPRIWPRPTEFLPERWVAASEDDPLYPATKFAWRPFEYGPMGCIGQELALIELKMALLFTVRELEFETALAEWDRARGIKTEERSTIFGDPIYQTNVGLGPPTEKLPMRVRRLRR